MKFGTIVKLKKDISQGFTTFEKGTLLAVAHYSHKYFVKLNTFGDQQLISDLIEIRFSEMDESFSVVGYLA